jgi:hypothetical protein
LINAIQKGHQKMVELLLEHGADVGTPNNEPALAMLKTWYKMEPIFMRLFQEGKIDPFANNCAVLKQAISSGIMSLVRQILAIPESRRLEPDKNLLSHIVNTPVVEFIPMVVSHPLCALPANAVSDILGSIHISDEQRADADYGVWQTPIKMSLMTTLLRRSHVLNDELRWQLMITAATHLGAMCSTHVADARYREPMLQLWNSMLSALQRGGRFYWQRNSGNILYRLIFWKYRDGRMPKQIRKTCQYYFINKPVEGPVKDTTARMIRNIFVRKDGWSMTSANTILSDATRDTVEAGRFALISRLIQVGRRNQYAAIHEELVRVTWHPDRMMEWCLAIDD